MTHTHKQGIHNAYPPKRNAPKDSRNSRLSSWSRSTSSDSTCADTTTTRAPSALANSRTASTFSLPLARSVSSTLQAYTTYLSHGPGDTGRVRKPCQGWGNEKAHDLVAAIFRYESLRHTPQCACAVLLSRFHAHRSSRFSPYKGYFSSVTTVIGRISNSYIQNLPLRHISSFICD